MLLASRTALDELTRQYRSAILAGWNANRYCSMPIAVAGGLGLALGLIWLVMIFCFLWRAPWAWCGMILCAVAGLWYLPFGTLLSLSQIVLLMLPAIRKLP